VLRRAAVALLALALAVVRAAAQALDRAGEQRSLTVTKEVR
jgi:hypothetical protein